MRFLGGGLGGPGRPRVGSRLCGAAHLGDVEVDVEALPIALHLPHPHLAGQVAGAGADTLQGESAVQVLLRAIPDVIKGDLLGAGGWVTERWCQGSWAWVSLAPSTLSVLTW